MRVRQVAQQCQHAGDEAAGLGVVAEQLAQLAGDQADADAVQVADQGWPRQEAGDETGAGEPGSDGQQADHHRDDHRQLQQALGIAGRQRGDRRRDHGRGGGVRADHQLPRTADQGVDQHRQDAGIQSDLGREADDLRIGDGGGNLDRGHRQPRLDIRRQPGETVVQQAVQAGEPADRRHSRDSARCLDRSLARHHRDAMNPYRSPRSCVGMQLSTLPRRWDAERPRMGSHAGAWEP
ncbi:hypothetical protein D9M71_228500 [compost metagenome]